jgi:hypothetical protein
MVLSTRVMSATYSFLVSAAGCEVGFETNSEQAFELLNRYVFPSIARQRFTPGQAEISIAVQHDAEGFHLLLDQSPIASAARPDGLLRELIDCLDTGLVRHLKNLHAIHAGAVLVGDQALLFPGSSHSGKSSLVAELLRRGAVCLSDEYALIDTAGRVHAYPRVLLLRNGGAAQTPVRPEECNAGSRVASDPASVGWILSIRYASEKGWDLASVPQSDALMSLLQNTPHVLAQRPQMVEPFKRAVAGAKCFAGTRGEAAEAVDEIMRMIAGD